MTGNELRNAIRGKGLSIQAAADKLGISRQGLYYIINKGKLGNDVLQTVKTKLHISENYNDLQEGDFREKYYEALEEIRKLQKLLLEKGDGPRTNNLKKAK